MSGREAAKEAIKKRSSGGKAAGFCRFIYNIDNFLIKVAKLWVKEESVK